MTMADEKRYFSVKDMFEQAATRAKTDPRYEEYSKICELDYDLLCSTCKYDKLYRCEFDVVGEVTYGGSEGNLTYKQFEAIQFRNQGYTNREIAELCGVGRKAIEKRFARIRKILSDYKEN